jgi:1,4-dihydroxy-2-naphthoate polyprenyltransferase
MTPLLHAIRPKTLVLSITPVLVGASLSLREDAFSIFNALVTLICALCLQITANLVNDYRDFKSGVDTERRIGPKRMASMISPHIIRRSYVATTVLAVVCGLYLAYVGGVIILITGLASIVCAYMYTAKKYPLSHLPIGELLAFAFFGPIAVCGTQYVLSNHITLLGVCAGGGLGCISAAVMAINNMRDRISDQAAGKKTLAVHRGENFSRRLVLMLVACSAVLGVAAAIFTAEPLITLVSVLWLLYLGTWKHIAHGAIDASQNNSLASTAQYAFIYGFTLSVLIFVTT